MQLFNKISSDVVEQLALLHLDLSHLWVLENLIDGTYYYGPESLLTMLDRKGYITYDKQTSTILITDMGDKLVALLSAPDFSLENIKVKKELKKVKGESDSRYQEWINIYPLTASWTTPVGTKLTSTRRLRQDNLENEKKYLAILSKGIYTHEQMCNVLRYQIELIKKESIKYRQNKMQFMQGTTPYLNQETFANFIPEMIKSNWQPDKQFTTEGNSFPNVEAYNL